MIYLLIFILFTHLWLSNVILNINMLKIIYPLYKMFFTLIMLVVSVCFLNFFLNNAIVHIVLYVYVCFCTILFNSSRCLLIDYLLIINVQFRIIILIIFFLKGNVKKQASLLSCSFHAPFNIFVILFM